MLVGLVVGRIAGCDAGVVEGWVSGVLRVLCGVVLVAVVLDSLQAVAVRRMAASVAVSVVRMGVMECVMGGFLACICVCYLGWMV